MYLYMYIIQGDDEMKITKIVYKILLIVLLSVICSSCVCYASADLNDPSIFKPTVSMGTSTANIVSKILGVLTMLGVAATFIGIALIGFNTLMGSASEKAVNQEKYVGIVIAALLIAGVSSIAKVIIGFAESII